MESNTGLVAPRKKAVSNWLKFGLPIAVAVILAAVLGGVLGSRAAKNKNSSTSSSGSSSDPAAASSAVSAKNAVGIFPTATDSEFEVPIYPSTVSSIQIIDLHNPLVYQTNTAAFSTPTFNSAAKNTWPEDPFQPSNPSPTITRTDRPRLIAPAYKWEALPSLIQSDPYLTSWNNTIFGNASDYYSSPVVVYFDDGSSGILDVARAVKERVKAFSYVFRMTNDTKWVDRCWEELQVGIFLFFAVYFYSFASECSRQ